jgi:hypothetical protein
VVGCIEVDPDPTAMTVGGRAHGGQRDGLDTLLPGVVSVRVVRQGCRCASHVRLDQPLPVCGVVGQPYSAWLAGAADRACEDRAV